MSWTLLLTIVLVLGLSLFASFTRRVELARMQRRVHERERAVRQGSDKAQLQHPVVDLSRCLGCATCVAVCPEDGVLEVVHGQAMVVNGARCVGVSACERECPVGAITVTIADLEERTDIPALSGLEAVASPGLFLAGEVTAHALIKTAIDHGTAVAAEVARRVAEADPDGAEMLDSIDVFDGTELFRDGRELLADDSEVLDLCIVGAGPAGLACSLEARRHGLRFVTLDQESGLGGTVAKYPRRKLVMSEPVDLPLYGRLKRNTYTKAELMDVWEGIAAEYELPIVHGEVFNGLDRDEDGNYLVLTETSTCAARYVCLALGRRGIPKKLGIPGEELPKVAYSLLDANSYQGRQVLVVGGGNSAIEAAMGLAEQPGNQVTLSYRKESFFRIRAKNAERLDACLELQQLQVIFSSQVLEIHPDSVELEVDDGTRVERYTLPNDDVFVMAGGTLPFELLERSGVSFDPSQRPAPEQLYEQGTGLIKALAIGFAVSLAALLWAAWNADYYALPTAERPTHPKHALLRPELAIGLGLGITAATLVVVNLLYVLRRSRRIHFGSLQLWMTSHVATGVLALLCATLHAAMSPRDSAGGHALWALAVLVLTGAIGRYFYAWVPRATNGRELKLAEVKDRLGWVSDEWNVNQRRYSEYARAEVTAVIEARQWRGSFFGRILALLGVQRDLQRLLTRLTDLGRQEKLDEDQIRETLGLARTAHRTALAVAHYEDLRMILSSWRYVHRWVAALMVLLVGVHIVHALVYGVFFGGGGLG